MRWSLKAPLVHQFRPMGYRLAPDPSDTASFTLFKPTPGQHLLRLGADRGTWSRSVSCQFYFVGLEKGHSVDLPAGADGRFQYRAGDQQQVDRVVASWAAIVEALEDDLVPRLEAIYGNDPPWFPAITMGGP